MSDLVVTVPKDKWPGWLAEGELARSFGVSDQDDAGATEWGFYFAGPRPPVEPGDRIYVVAHDRLRGYAPLTRVASHEGLWVLCRQGKSEAVTIDDNIRGFRGWKERWWPRELERPFPAWKGQGIGLKCETCRIHRRRPLPAATHVVTRLGLRGTVGLALCGLCKTRITLGEPDVRVITEIS